MVLWLVRPSKLDFLIAIKKKSTKSQQVFLWSDFTFSRVNKNTSNLVPEEEEVGLAVIGPDGCDTKVISPDQDESHKSRPG